MFNEKAFFGKTTQTWKCLIRNYERDKNQRCQVFGHIAATHGYTSREPNERWGIAIQGKYNVTAEPVEQPVENEEMANKSEPQNYQIQINNGGKSYICNLCRRKEIPIKE